MAIMHGSHAPLDTRWGLVWLLMEETGWSWTELAATPWGLVMEALNHIAAKRHWAAERQRLDAERRK